MAVMRSHFLRAAGGSLLAALLVAAGITAVSGAAQAADPVRIMPLGDSITDGFNVPGGYRITLKPKLDAGGYATDFVGTQSNGPASLIDREHEGFSGWRIDQLDANIVTWLQQTTPDTVLLHAGTNDMIQGIDLANAPTRLGGLIDKITATRPDAVVLVASIVPLTDAALEKNVLAFNAAIPGVVQTRVAAGKHVHFVDMHAAVTTADLADGIHPSEAGYAKMATVWYDALRTVPGALASATPTSPATTAPTTPTTAPTTPTTTPTTVPTSAAPNPTTTPRPAGACSATFTVVGQWSGGFQASVQVVNGGSPVTEWSVAWTPSGYTVAQSWGTTLTTTGSLVVAKNVSWNGSLAAGGSAEFGVLGSGTLTGTPLLTCTA
ncbi:MAG TPA: GDSL-type esterase/lipase family protein [Actinoplanes sp.]